MLDSDLTHQKTFEKYSFLLHRCPIASFIVLLSNKNIFPEDTLWVLLIRERDMYRKHLSRWINFIKWLCTLAEWCNSLFSVLFFHRKWRKSNKWPFISKYKSFSIYSVVIVVFSQCKLEDVYTRNSLRESYMYTFLSNKSKTHNHI